MNPDIGSTPDDRSATEIGSMASVRRGDASFVLRFRRRLAHQPEKVWRALTESDHLEHWMPCDIVGERREGAAIELRFWPAHIVKYEIDEPALQGEIRVWDPPTVFEWTWDTDVLRWELEAVDGGTLLTFTTWLGGADASDTANTAAGYHVCLDHLKILLDTGSAEPLVDANVEPWEIRYALAAIAAETS